jgi:predicted pyridoxine 5'-phosphate oxidase superfamily flavin-nucleotide-binding protein
LVISITGEMRDILNNALADGVSCILGTASADGRPQISMKGSVAVYDEETLSYWERSLRSALENVTENPNVVIFYRNPGKRINWRFHGTATVHQSGEIRDKVMGITPKAELDRDPDRKGVAVLVKVNRITELSGRVLQER